MITGQGALTLAMIKQFVDFAYEWFNLIGEFFIDAGGGACADTDDGAADPA